MPLNPINVGAAANDNTGDSLRNAFIKVNDNCTYLDGKAPNAHTHPLSQLTQSGATNGQIATWNGTAWVATTPASSGTVTSVGLSLPALFSVTGTPVTTSGTLTATLATQSANIVFAGPTNGAAATPTFRALVASDIPALSYEASGSIAAHAALTSGTHGISNFIGSTFLPSNSAPAARFNLGLGSSAIRDESYFALASHSHGNITSAGAIGTTSALPLITGVSGVIETGTWGTTIGTFCQGNDSRLSNARTPTAHTHALSDLTQSGAANGQVVSWNGTAWAPANVAASQNTFSTISIAGQSSVVADTTSDTLTLVAGSNITLTTDATTDTITISASGGAGGGGNISGPNSGITDNAIVRWDLNNTTIQNSVVTVSDTGEFAGANSVAFSTSPSGSSAIGKVLWNSTNKTLSLGIGDGSVSALLGVDSHVLVRNTTGVQINKGQVVRVNGASTGNMTVALAQGNNDANTTTTIGVAAENIANSGTGMVMVTGLIGGLDTSTWTAGDMLFISATTAGLLVNAAPTAPNHAVRMGYVVSSHPNSGIIYVNVDNGYELDELHDVAYPTAVANNDFLVYTTNRWENKTPANARTALGLGTAATSNTGDFATASHVHGNITNAGAIGVTANLPLITTTSGVITTGSFGSTANTFCQGNDSRLSDSRTPTAHAASHAAAGSDPLTLSQSQITNLTTDLAAKAPSASPTFTGQVVTDAGTVSAPSITTTGDLNTGFYYPAADSIGITTGGSDRVRIGANGAVGIGTTSTASWDANSLVIAASQGTYGQLIIQQTGGSGAANVGANINFYGNNGSSSNTYGEIRVRKENATVGNNASYISFCNVASGGTSVAERMRITAAGSVLINSAALSTSATDGFLYIPSCPGLPTGTPTTQSGRNPLIVDSTNSKLYFYSGGAWTQAGGGGGSATTNGSTNLFIPAAQWIPRTTNGCGINSLETTTNKINYDVLEFDAATAEYAQAVVVMPSNYNGGTITAKFHWTAASGTGAVIFGLAGRSFGDNSALDQAMGTAQTATDTLQTAAAEHISPATSAITLGGTVTAGNAVIFQLYRDASNASDTLGVDAQFLGVEISYTAA